MKKHEMMKNSIRDSVPEIWDASNKTIHFGYTPRISTSEDDEEVTQYEGYAIPLSGHMDYGHIKSQIIQYVYADKDVDGLINNLLMALISRLPNVIPSEKHQQYIQDFRDFSEWRDDAARAAKELLNSIK